MIEEFVAGFITGLICLVMLLILKMPWLKIWGQYKQVVLSVDKSNTGKIRVVPARRGQWGEAGNPAGRGTVLFNTTPIWIPELRQRWFLHYGEQCCTIEAEKAAFASHMKGLGIFKKELGIAQQDKKKGELPPESDPIAALEKNADIQPSSSGICFDLRDCAHYYADAINPEEIDSLTDAAAIEKTGLRRILEGAKKGLNWGMLLVVGILVVIAIFVLPSILQMLGVA